MTNHYPNEQDRPTPTPSPAVTFDAASINANLKQFDMADTAELDCGDFDIVIRQAAIHNEAFRAAVVKKTMAAKKKSLVAKEGTTTGSYEEDVNLFIEMVLVGWGERPFMINGVAMPWTPENLQTLFSTERGKVLFAKIQVAAIDEQLFVIREEDLGNS